MGLSNLCAGIEEGEDRSGPSGATDAEQATVASQQSFTRAYDSGSVCHSELPISMALSGTRLCRCWLGDRISRLSRAQGHLG